MKKEGINVKAAVASRTDEPRWAKICMEYMVIDDGSNLASCFESRIEISYGTKVGHITRLQKSTGIAFEDMCFFDNEYSNIRDVSKKLPEVKCYYTPDGMTSASWEQAKADFGMS
jgi:magnesium-dependent phosphatase 1